jgi:membrane protease YdiL (CAAX protease family)
LSVARKGRTRHQKALALDPYLTFAIFAGVGLATWKLDQLLRLTVLWLTLLVFTLAYASGKKIELRYGFAEILRGGMAGVLISLPVVLLTRDFVLATSQRIFSVDSTLYLFWALVLIMPPIEALYFRGFLQMQKGLWATVLLYAATTALYFMPSTLGDYSPVLAALVGGMGLLGFVYGYIRTLYGFGASLACQVAVHFILFILPLLPQEVARLLV